MDSNLKKLLKRSRAGDVFYSHVSLIDPLGKFAISRNNMEEFWKLYCDSIFQNENPSIGLAEHPQVYSPVRCDVDLRINMEDIDPEDEKEENEKEDEDEEEKEEKTAKKLKNYPESLYSEEQLFCVIDAYQVVLRKIISGIDDKDLACVVLEKPIYQQTRGESTYLKHGFHLHFPYIFLDKNIQETQVIPRVKDFISERKVFRNIVQDSESVIDGQACITNSWLLYGSKKNPDAKAYKATKIVSSEKKILTLEEGLSSYEIYNNRGILIPVAGKVEYYLPRILSLIPYERKNIAKELKRGVVSPLKEKMRKERKASAINKMSVEQAIATAKKLLPMLSDSRADLREDWMRVGWILYSITEGHPDAFDLWCEFSARCEEKYDENVCISEWEKMTKKDISIGTLRYYASLDSPEEYKKFKQENVEARVRISIIDASHNDIAKVLFEEFGDEFKCASVNGGCWFQFSGHVWKQVEKGIYLRQHISGKIVDKFNEVRKKLCDEEAGSAGNDKALQAMYTTKIKQINKLIASLKNSTFKNNVMKECEEVFYDPLFKEKLDTNPYLIAFKNGVYDLKNNIFRSGLPEDYLSKTLPINYRFYKDDDKDILEINSFLEKTFPDKEVRRYFLDTHCEVFVGGNHEKIGVFWTGAGDNGKSVTQSFFEKMLGPLAVKMATVNITGKKPAAGGANADLSRTGGGVRWLVLEEPESEECINSGTFKHWTGNDSYFARDLFERGKEIREIIPLFKLIFICNKLPKFRNADKATWNRVKVIPFEATFCRPENPAPESYEEQLKTMRFPMDKHFSKKIPDLVEAFAFVLLQHRLKPKMGYEPKKIQQATENYRKQNDFYKKFTEECIIEDKDKFISLSELYALFVDWFRDGYRNQTIPIKDDIEEYFSKLWGAPRDSSKKWYGFRARIEKDDIIIPKVEYKEKKEEEEKDLESEEEIEIPIVEKKKSPNKSKVKKIVKKTETKLTDFVVGKKIEEGGQGSIYLATKKDKEGILKCFHDKAIFDIEVKALSSIEPHKGIVKLFESFSDDSHRCVFLEKVEGKTLDRIKPIKNKLKSCFKKIIKIIQHIHKCGYLYGDIKLENFICDEKDNYSIKLVDFGFCLPLGSTYKTGFGTEDYLPPETIRSVIEKKETEKVESYRDIWALGVLFYELATGNSPFGIEYSELHDDILSVEYRLVPEDSAYFKGINKFISCFLQADRMERISLEKALEHEFLLENK